MGRFTLRDGTAAQPALDAVQRRAGQPRWRERVASAAQAPVRIPGNLVGV